MLAGVPGHLWHRDERDARHGQVARESHFGSIAGLLFGRYIIAVSFDNLFESRKAFGSLSGVLVIRILFFHTFLTPFSHCFRKIFAFL